MMSTILDKIADIQPLYTGHPCTLEQLEDAQRKLGITFPNSYANLLKKYGTISFYATEWNGLNTDSYLNVVFCTLEERKRYPAFPNNMFVLENIGIDGILTLCDEKGIIYSWQDGSCYKLSDSLSSYLDICIERNK